IYNLPPNTTRLKEAVPAKPSLPEGIIQGQNDFKKIGYNGPAPPRGAAHHYHFKLLALDTKLDLKPGATKKQFSEAIKGHIIGQTELVAIYSRK
ncbi:MAG: YbhB/YbcL family Raf kinase inhibitor-like protein, partial [Candidatus Obscuribacterales bacterium]|nr:YbhB/YbcL family Raf kinase inhibitor-like protein [Candidatus Obscuribacterales bacterium]